MTADNADIIETGKEVAEEISEDVKEVFGEGKNEIEKFFNETKPAVPKQKDRNRRQNLIVTLNSV